MKTNIIFLIILSIIAITGVIVFEIFFSGKSVDMEKIEAEKRVIIEKSFNEDIINEILQRSGENNTSEM